MRNINKPSQHEGKSEARMLRTKRATILILVVGLLAHGHRRKT